MRKIVSLLLLLFVLAASAQPMKSIKECGVSPSNSPEKNRVNLQRAIDEASATGAALYVEPVAGGYPVAAGIILRQNVSLIGAHGPVGRGTKAPGRQAPIGSLFVITDASAPFITVESATQLRGIQFYYPEQSHDDPTKIIAYPPTIQVSREKKVEGVTLSSLTFFGEYMAMDFNASPRLPCEQILFEHCYGYPLGGEFIRIDYCYDIPRILHCHVNPANMRQFGRSFSRSVVDAVVAKPTFSYAIDHTDNAQMIDVFTFGVHGGILLGAYSYGQLTNFNLDCVSVGIHKKGASSFNRNWQIAQGSIIANVKGCAEGIHSIIIEGQGHTSISNVEAFSGPNGALTADGFFDDFLHVRGDKLLTVTLYGCRMRNYRADSPVSVENPNARIEAVACVDKDEKFFSLKKE
ncbi:MAG: hypothetical protein IKY69_04660 [Bacteroidaceae bacterium]|nr:hypothetical protein [Bacteroidaceae bacterium]